MHVLTGPLFGYVPNMPANIIGAVVFGIFTVVQFVLGLYTKDWWMFTTWTFSAGGECAAYISRSLLHTQYTSFALWQMNLVLTVLCPVFMCAGLYYQLGAQVVIYGQKYSYLKPMTYNAIFTSCDVVALMIQSGGGGMAAKGSGTGAWIIVGGIIFQVITLTVFIIMFGLVNYKIHSDNKFNWDPNYASVRSRKLFRFWTPAVLISLLFMLIRSIYRIVELATGWDGYVMRTETYFLVLDGLMIALSMLPLCVIYPSLAHGGVSQRRGDKEKLDSKYIML